MQSKENGISCLSNLQDHAAAPGAHRTATHLLHYTCRTIVFSLSSYRCVSATRDREISVACCADGQSHLGACTGDHQSIATASGALLTKQFHSIAGRYVIFRTVPNTSMQYADDHCTNREFTENYYFLFSVESSSWDRPNYNAYYVFILFVIICYRPNV